MNCAEACCVLPRCQPGDAELVVEDWDTQEELTLALDSTKPPVASAEALYKRARKQRRAVDHVQPLLAVRSPGWVLLPGLAPQLQRGEYGV